MFSTALSVGILTVFSLGFLVYNGLSIWDTKDYSRGEFLGKPILLLIELALIIIAVVSLITG